MIDIEQIIKEVSKRNKIDLNIVSTVCKHVFIETQNTMKDDTDTMDILFNSLFKFKLKRRYKENKSNEYKSK